MLEHIGSQAAIYLTELLNLSMKTLVIPIAWEYPQSKMTKGHFIGFSLRLLSF